MYVTNYIKNWDDVVAHVLDCYPEEAAGIITTDNLFIPYDNIAKKPLISFQIDRRCFIDYDVKAILHSHVYNPSEPLVDDPRIPSKADLQGQISTAVEWGIVVCEGENVTQPFWFGDYDHRPDLMDREFIHNMQDCYAFMCDWQYAEYGVKMKNRPRNFDWFTKGENIFDDDFEKWGFKDVSHLEEQRGDVILMKIQSEVTNHIGVVLEPNLIAHHLFGRFPVVEPKSKWHKYITRRVRHKSHPAFGDTE